MNRGFAFLSLLACSGLLSDEPETMPPAETPAPPQPVVPEPVDPVVTDAPPDSEGWPLHGLGRIPAGRGVPLPTGHQLVDLDLDAQGRFAVLVTTTGLDYAAWTWDFGQALAPLSLPGAREFALSRLDDTAYAIVHDGTGWSIVSGRASGGAWAGTGVVSESEHPLSSLIAPFVRYDGEERVFYARAYEGQKTQVLSTRRSGSRTYEVTTPDGKLGPLTDADIREPADEWQKPPVPVAAQSATPLSLHPATGALLWRDGDGGIHERAWDSGNLNWGDDATYVVSGHYTWSPNGYYAVGWSAERPGVRLRDPYDKELEVTGPQFLAPPATAENGRTLVGPTAGGLVTVAVEAPLAPVRHLTAVMASAAEEAALARAGMHLSTSRREQLYEVYDGWLYDDTSRPVFASLDGMLEVLHAGFQGVFLQVERDVAIPRLHALVDALETAARQRGIDRVSRVAMGTRSMLQGDYAFPDGQAALAEGSLASEDHGDTVDFADFHPRGPYATSEALSNYFRAFKYIDSLKLSREERDALRGEPGLVAAWRAWIDAQSPYLSGSRYDGALGAWDKTPHARADCPSGKVAKRPERIFPLSWGRDSEILERVTAHDELAGTCTVPERGLPSGLDLLTGLGSRTAREQLRAAYDRYPDLDPVHDELQARFGAPIQSERFVDNWLRLVQLLGNDETTPEGVDPERWRARLWETALASWTSFRHTTVLVNETSAAQMGGGGPEGFEYLTTEPMRGVVDPVPEAWAQVALLLDRLAEHDKHAATPGRVPEVLADAATDARRLGLLAERQGRDEPLSDEDYQFIRSFAGTTEHPFLLLSATAAGKEMEISAPDPMMKIVDVHTWNDPLDGTREWHAAVGRPRSITVLLGDRGLLIPGYGAVYSYYEVVAGTKLDDEAWRKQVDNAERPDWANEDDN